MTGLTIIEFQGNPVGVVADGHARINEELVAPEALATVKGMALFAIEVQAGNIDGPYTQSRARVYANEANRQRATAASPSPVRPGRG
jgi:hypothetical protein